MWKLNGLIVSHRCSYTVFSFSVVFLLALNRTNRQTGNKGTYWKNGYDARNGNDDNDCDCHTNGFGRHRVTVLLQTQTCAGVIGDVLQVLHHVVQQCLQGYQLGIRNIQGGLEPVIPVAEGQKQRNCGKNRLGDGHHDTPENFHLGCAVNLCRLNDGIRYRCSEEGLADNNIEAAHRQRQNQTPDGVVQTQHIGNNHIVCNHAAIENHRDEYNHCKKAIQRIVAS